MEDEVEKLDEEICEEVVANENFERLQRLQAEFENFRRRSEAEKCVILKNAEEDLVVELLNVLDSFELSLKHCEDEGVRLIYSKFYDILKKRGLRVVGCEGNFDAAIHEALTQDVEAEDGKIVEVFSKGYFLNDKLIRAAKVKIGVKKA